ncbi:exopolysaccharide production protein ExoZ [Bradyrhizobium sp. i1.15.2]|uniref:acyltransferase family protein n=1 Tax=Bradyrhizobium sp. i1.15.2 TaxID=3156362 RepID=UPI003391A570
MTTRQNEIFGIQYLRGIAAGAVVADHATGMAAFPKYFGSEAFSGVLLTGARGVDLFFLISGFIIAVVSLTPRSLEARVSPYEFARRRLIRIVPLMWLAIGSYMALRLLGRGSFDLWPYLRALTLWPAGDVNPSHLWTLRNEAFFYFLFASTFLGVRGIRWAAALWVVAAVLYPTSGISDGPTLTYQQWMYAFAHPANVEFAAGLGLALIWLRSNRGQPFSLRLLWPVCVVWFAVTIHFVSSLLGDWPRVYIDLIWAAAFLPLLTLAVLAKTIPSRLGLLLGDASFSIYLFHPHFISAVLGVWSAVAPSTPVWIVVIATSLIAIGCGVIIHLTVERWILGRLKGVGMRVENSTGLARTIQTESS